MITKKQLKLSHELDSFVDNAKASASENTETSRPRRGRRAHPDADSWTRQTFIVSEAHLDMLRRMAYWERATTKELLDKALAAFLRDKKYGPIPISE